MRQFANSAMRQCANSTICQFGNEKNKMNEIEVRLA